MILHEVQLTNIGPYRGITNCFNFETNNKQNKNVILIGGENGAGKTTLLNAVKLGLFGSYSFGYKTENTEYFNKVQNILNQDAKRINENNFRIRLRFSLVDNFEKINYVLYRNWKFNNNSLKEEFEVIANNCHLSDYEKEIFQSKLKAIIPPQLLDLCLFDGEEISRIVNEDLLSEYLEKLTSVVFNLDLFETLENDLKNFASKEVDKKKKDSLEQEFFLLKVQRDELRQKIFRKKSELEQLTYDKATLESELFNLRMHFKKHGGLVKSQRDEINRKINEIEVLRKRNIEIIKDFISNLLPFYLTKNLINETRKQMKEEEALHLYRQLSSLLTDEKIKDIIHSTNLPNNANISNTLRENILNLLKPEKTIIQIHEASFSESSLVENIHLIISSDRNKEILELIEKNKEKLLKLQELKEKLKVNDSTSEFSDMIFKMQDYQQKIYQIEEKIENFREQIEIYNQEFSKINNQFEKKKAELINNEKTSNSFRQAQKIIELSHRFRQIQLQKKLQDVQIEATSMLKKILRKRNYITNIIIDHKTYDVQLFDSHGDIIDRTTLSAGEKEILLISIIWAIFKCSGRNVPLIFDTLLGRLDKTHKASILKEFIPNCSEQAIILSTDTEIDERNYRILKPFISKEYMLDFNVKNKQTNIKHHYFFALENRS